MGTYLSAEFADWQIRVIEETQELTEKIDKLYSFLEAQKEEERVPKDVLNIMGRQYEAMCNYRRALRDRIGLFF